MAKNEKMSCSSNYRHTGIQFFWAEDRLKQEKISVKYCSTENIWKLYSPNLYRVASSIFSEG